MFLDIQCPRCGAVCGNNGQGFLCQCSHCGWKGAPLKGIDMEVLKKIFVQHELRNRKENQTMKAILKQPGQRPAVVEMENTLTALQKSVGGYIETVRITSDACLICNEEGLLIGLEPNPVMGISLVGPVLCVGVNEDEFCSLTDEDAEFLLRQMEG